MKAPLFTQRHEEGAEIIQFTLALPVLMLLIAATIQLCVIAFSGLVLSNCCEQAAWNVDLSKLCAAGNGSNAANELISDSISSVALGLVGNLEVSGASFNEETQPEGWLNRSSNISDVCTTTATGDLFAAGNTMDISTAVGTVAFQVTYHVPTFLPVPGLTDITITRDISRERIKSTRVEIKQ